MIRFRTLSLAVALSCAGAAHAEDLMQIYQEARTSDPTLAGAEATKLATDENVDQARSVLLPQIGVNLDFSRSRAGENGSTPIELDPINFPGQYTDVNGITRTTKSRSTSAQLNQSILDISKWTALKASRYTAQAGAATYDAAQQQLLISTAQAYFNVLTALDAAGLRDSTRVLYTSDHGENAGKRGFWGKSNHYQEAVAIPMIVTGEGIPAHKLSSTPVSLVDAYPTVLDGVGLPADADGVPGKSLFEIANSNDDRDRVAFSEYHAAGSPSASYMLRKGRFKYISYVGFEPELFDLEKDPEESTNLAGRPEYAETLKSLDGLLRTIVDPEKEDRRANDAQRTLIESKGGPDQVMANLPTKKLYTPVPTGLIP